MTDGTGTSTPQSRYRQTEQGKKKHREAERRRSARKRGEDVPKLLQNGEKTHCGVCALPYDEANTAYAADGSRRCKNCHNNRVKEAYAADPEAGRQRSRDKYARHGAEWNQKEREQRAADPERFREAERVRYEANPEPKRSGIYRNRHGLKPGDWEAVWDLQEGRCYLCDEMLPEPPTGGGKGGSFNASVIDHDYRCCPSGKSCKICRRGLACGLCNSAIGHAGDDPERLRRMASALEAAKAAVEVRMKAATEEGRAA